MALGQATKELPRFTPEQRDRILRAIEERLAGRVGCVLCGHGTLILVDTPMHLTNWPPDRIISGYTARVLPCIVLVCHTCGNTHLLAMSRLGLGDLVPSWLSE